MKDFADRLRSVAAELMKLSDDLDNARVVREDWKGLSTRARNSLTRGGYMSRDQIARATDDELYSVPRLGRMLVSEVRAWLAGEPPPDKSLFKHKRRVHFRDPHPMRHGSLCGERDYYYGFYLYGTGEEVTCMICKKRMASDVA